MVLQVMKWNIHPDKTDIYFKWVETAIKRILTSKVNELRAYRPITGDSQIAVTLEFSDLASWTDWQGNTEVKKVLTELRTMAVNVNIEVWGPSPVVTKPVQFF
jgi:hypothetical protein